MNTLKTKSEKMTDEAMVRIPLSAFRFIFRYPREKRIICEINTDEIERLNDVGTLDEVINEARLDYASGDYKTFADVKDLIAELHS